VAGWTARCYAWNKAGHMVTGSIAYSVLKKESPDTLAAAVDLLKKHPNYLRWKRQLDEYPAKEHDRGLLMLAARWPDDIRGNKTYDHPKWHYVDFPYKPPKEPKALRTIPPEPENALRALHDNLAQLDGGGDAAEKAVALCWVFHLVGDIHQPLHAASLFTTTFPAGDAGGSRSYVRFTPEEPPASLHFFWDDVVILSESFEAAQRRASQLLRRPEFRPRRLVELESADFEWWAKVESFRLAKKIVYRNGSVSGSPERDSAPVLPDDYEATAKPVAERQIVLAGYRLARLLQHTLEPEAKE
jgi:hypothetical protein